MTLRGSDEDKGAFIAGAPGAGMAKQEEVPKKKTMQDKIGKLNAKRAELELGGGKERIDKQHESGKLSARERVTRLVDQGQL